MNPQLSQELEVVMRNYIKYLLEREIKSVTWLDALKEQIKQVAPSREIASDNADKQSSNHMALL